MSRRRDPKDDCGICGRPRILHHYVSHVARASGEVGTVLLCLRCDFRNKPPRKVAVPLARRG